jgi:transcription factor SPT20
MATAVVTARPSQALRQRRESHRPGLARVSTRATTVEASEVMPSVDPAEFGELSREAHTPACSLLLTVGRAVLTEDYILKKFSGNPPSLILHLHKTHFRFDQQDGNFSYNSEMRSFIEHLKNRTVPHEILEELFASGVRFYDGKLGLCQFVARGMSVLPQL